MCCSPVAGQVKVCGVSPASPSAFSGLFSPSAKPSRRRRTADNAILTNAVIGVSPLGQNSADMALDIKIVPNRQLLIILSKLNYW